MMETDSGPNRGVAVVTGGAGGIGYAIAAGLRMHGFDVVITSRSGSRAQAAADRLCADRAAPGQVFAHSLEITDTADSDGLVAFMDERWGGIDVLVNNAGIYPEAPHFEPPEPGTALEQSVDRVRQTLEVNLLGPYHLTQCVIALMQRRGRGRIVNVSSGSGQLADMGGGAVGYRISKAALNAMTCIFAAELQGTDILVNSMCPGWVHTELGGPDAPRTPEEGADTAIWLATLPVGGPSGGFFRNHESIAF